MNDEQLRGRPTADIILLILTGLISLSILLTGAGIFMLALFHPTADLSVAFNAIGSVLTLLTGTVVGYLAGRGRSPASREGP